MQNQQPPEQQKNLILAITLSMAVVFGWQYFYAGPKMKDEQERLKRLQAQSQSTSATPGGTAVGAPGQVAVPGAIAPAATLTREQALATSPRVAIDTPLLKGSIALKGARIDDVALAKYRETVKPDSPIVKLLSPSDAPEPFFAEYGWVGAGGTTQKLPDRDTLWSQGKPGALTPAQPLALSWDNGQGLKFARQIAVDANYMFTVTDTVENTSGAEVTLYPYARIQRVGLPTVQANYLLHEGPLGFVGDAGLQELAYTDMLKDGGGKTIDKAANGWLGFTDKYWAAALIPNQGETFKANFSGQKKVGTAKESFQTDYLLGAQVIPPGQKKTVEGRLFAGAKDVKQIQSYTDDLKINKFDLMIDWGWFYFITKPMFYMINWLSTILGNFGWAILAVTVIVKGAFYPLANKSYESMAKMKKLQPEMERLKERYKDDKVGMQKELMGLYQKEKINPMAGCLPVLLQIPIMYALDKVLLLTIEMRHQPFVLWIRDLAAPDPLTPINLFGLLPFSPPAFIAIGIIPILLGVSMYFQFKLNPQPMDEAQKQVFAIMPWMLMFVMAPFAVGLQLYWITSNVLTILQQRLLYARHPEMLAPAK